MEILGNSRLCPEVPTGQVSELPTLRAVMALGPLQQRKIMSGGMVASRAAAVALAGALLLSPSAFEALPRAHPSWKQLYF